MNEFVVYSLRVSADMETPISIYEKYSEGQTGFLLESKEQPKGRYSLIGRNPYQKVKFQNGVIEFCKDHQSQIINDKEYFSFLKELFSEVSVADNQGLPFVGGAVGTMAYDMVREFEEIPQTNPDLIGVPDSELHFYKEVILFDHYFEQVILVVLDTPDNKETAGQRLQEIQAKIFENITKKPASLATPAERISEQKTVVRSHTTKETFISQVKKVLDYIRAGDVFQVVLSQRWSAKTNRDSFSIYRTLRQINPSPYLFYLNFKDYQVMGSSPEMLTELRNDKILTCPIAGTRKRGQNEQEDQRLAKDLLEDPKERAEHFMLVDLGRNDMGRVAEIGSVHVSKLMDIHYYSHVMHMVSLVEGIRKKEYDMFDILKSFFPAGTLSGAPKIRAMEIIEELEEEKRGLYGGAVGYFGFDGNMDTCITIRTILKKEDTVYFQAGAGIVADSVPEKEFEETENKVKGMLRAIE